MATIPVRREQVTVTVLDGEGVVFDARANEAHRLSTTATAIWQQCDGVRTTDTIAGDLGLSAVAVRAAVDELSALGLMDTGAGPSRRRMLQGGAALGVAVVGTVALPRAAAASTGGGPIGGTPTSDTFDLYQDVKAHGYAGAFRFLQGSPGASASPVTAPYTDAGTGAPGTVPAEGYQGSQNQGQYGNFPIFYTVTGGDYIYSTGSVDVPGPAFALHPGAGPGAAAVVAFVAPRAYSSVSLSGTLISRNKDSSNGVKLDVQYHYASIGGSMTSGAPGGTAPISATAGPVVMGDLIYLVIDDNGGFGSDTTQVNLTVVGTY